MSKSSIVTNLNVSLGDSSDDLESSNNNNSNRQRASSRRSINRNSTNNNKSNSRNSRNSKNNNKSKSRSARKKRNKSKSGTPSYKAKDVENMVKLDVQNDVEEGDDKILSDDERAFTQQVTKTDSPVSKIEDIAVTANCDGMRVFWWFFLWFLCFFCWFFLMVFF